MISRPDAAKPAVAFAARAREMIIVLAGSGLLAVSAKVAVPFYPVPMTLQSLCVIVLGFTLGRRRAAAAVLAYLAEGMIGLPVFSGLPGAGLQHLLGPTGGYLFGYLVAAVVAGSLAERGWTRSALSASAAALLAGLSIYPLGLIWLGLTIGFDQPVFELGFAPFLLGDMGKAVLAGLLCRAVRGDIATGGKR